MSSIDIKLKIDTTEARKGVEDFANNLKKAENATKGASESIGSSVKTIREEIRKQMEATKNSITSFTTQIAEEKAVIKGIAADVANLQKSFDKTAPGKQRGGIESELNAAKKALEEEKAALASLEEQQRSARTTLGDLKQQYSGYTAQIKEASEKNKQYASIFKMLPQPIQGVVTATKNLTKASLAFITTPLGAVLMVLVGAYQAVSTWATYSKEGQDALAASSAYLSGVMNSLREIVIDAGKAIYMAFNDPKQAVINLWESIKKNLVKRVEGLGGVFKALGKILSSGFTSGYGDLADAFIQVNTGVEDFSKKAKNYVENAQEMAEKTKKLQQEETKLNDAKREASKKLAEYDKKIAEAREKSTNQELSNTERKKATEEAKQLIKEKYDLEKKLSDEELRIQRERMELTTNTNQDYDKETALEVKLLKLEAERENQLKALNRTSGSVSKEIISAQKASANATIELELKAQRERLAVLEDSKDKSIALIEIETKERLAAIDKEEKALTEKNKKAGISGLTKEQSETFTVRRKVVSDDAAKKRFDIEYQYNTETEKLYEQLTDVFLTEEERKTKAVQERYDEMRKAAKEQYDNEISAINITKQGPERDTAIKQATDKYNETNTLIDTAQAREELNAVLEEYKGFQQQRIEIEAKYNNDIQKLQEQLTKTTNEEEKKRLQESLKAAEEKKKKELSGVDLQEFQKEIDWSSVFGNLDKLSTDALKTLRDKIKEYLSTVGDSISKEDLKTVVEAFNNLDSALTSRSPIQGLTDSFKEYKEAAEKVAKAQEKVNDLQSKGDISSAALKKATKELTDAQNAKRESLTKMTQAVNDIGDKGSQLVSAGNDITNMLSSLGIEIPESLSGVLDGLGQITSSLSSVDLTKPFSIITGITGTLAGLGKTIGSIFGLGSDDGTVKYEALKEQLEGINEIYSKIVDKSKEKIKFGDGFAAVEAAEEANEALKKQIDNYRRLAEAGGKAGASAGSHSYAYRANERLKGDFNDISKEIGKNISSVQDMYNLTGDQLYIIQTKFPEAWSKIPSEITESLNKIIECKDESEELASSLKEALTGVSYDSFYNGFIDELSDMSTSFEDMCDNFEDDLRKSILAGLVASQYKGRIEDLYNRWSEYAKSDKKISKTEAENLRKEQKEIIEDMMRDRENLAKTFGWETSPDQVKSQSGAISETITEQTASELTGLWRGSYDTLKGIYDVNSSFYESYKSTIATSNAILSRIAVNTETSATNTTEILSEIVSLRTDVQSLKDTRKYS